MLKARFAKAWRPVYALQLAHETGSGVSGNYWVAKPVQGHVSEGRGYIDAELYKDATERAAGKEPIVTLTYDVGGTDYTTYFSTAALNVVDQNPMERAYMYLKTLDGTDPHGIDFSSALDV